MRKNRYYLIIIGILVILGIGIYYSPSQSKWILSNSEYPIKTARNCSEAFLNTNKMVLLPLIDKSNKTLINEIKSLDIPELSLFEIEKKCMELSSDSLRSSCLSQMNWANRKLRLMAFERTGSGLFVVVTFAYEFNNGTSKHPYWVTTYIPGKGPLLITVGLAYDSQFPDSICSNSLSCDKSLKLYEFRQKVLNLPLIRKFSESKGLTGKWVVDTIHYSYDLNDYFNWIIKSAQNKQEVTDSMYDNKKTQGSLEQTEKILDGTSSAFLECQNQKFQNPVGNYYFSWFTNQASSQFKEIQQTMEREYKLSDEGLFNLLSY